MSPMHHSGNNQTIDISDDLFEQLAFFRRLRGNEGKENLAVIPEAL